MEKRNGKIEFLRFIMASIIVLHHSGRIEGVVNPLPRGSLAVEFFFLASGYLMAAHCYKKRETRCENIGQETVSYIASKIRPFFLMMVLAEVFALAINLATSEISGKLDVLTRVAGAISECLLMNMTGFRMYALNAVWYLSAMIISMTVLYPFCRSCYDTFTHIAAPILGVMIIGGLYLAFGTQTGPNEAVLGCMYRGLLRGLAEICLGCVSFEISRRLSKTELTTLGKVCISAAETTLYLIAVLFMTLKTLAFDTFVLYLLFAGVTLSFSHKGIGDECFDNRIFYSLGRFSLPLYLGHIYLTDFINVLPLHNSSVRLIVYTALAVCSAFVLIFLTRQFTAFLAKIKTLVIKS